MMDSNEPQPPQDKPSEEERKEDSNASIFRRAALERLSVPDQLNKLFVPAPTYLWLVWVAIGVISTAFLMWLFFGSIPVFIEGVGIVMNKKGLFTIQSKTSGIVEEILIRPGDTVAVDQLVAKIYDPQEKLRYQSALERYKALEEDLNKLEKQVQIEEIAQKEAIQKQIAVEEFTIHQLEQVIPKLEEEEQTKKNLLEQGLISSIAYQESKQSLSQRQIALETARGTLATLRANFSKSYREQEVLEKQRDLLDARQQQELLRLSIHYDYIFSPSNGRVLEILVDKGYHVKPGTPLIHLEFGISGKAPHIFYAYVPLDLGKRVELGTRVEVELSTVRVEEYGAIVGKVTAVSHYAVSKENLANLIQNEGLVNFLTRGADAVVQVTVEPVLDPTTPTGYKWTSGEGPDIQITTGTVCTVRGIVDRMKPLYYFFHFAS